MFGWFAVLGFMWRYIIVLCSGPSEGLWRFRVSMLHWGFRALNPEPKGLKEEGLRVRVHRLSSYVLWVPRIRGFEARWGSQLPKRIEGQT